jgi:hypothetical protein
MIKKIIIVSVILSFIGCKKEKYTSESILLENLKESYAHYQSDYKLDSMIIEERYSDFGIKTGHFDTLKLITTRIDKLIKDIKSKEKKERIALAIQEIRKINKLKSKYKIDLIDRSKLEVLDNEVLYYYLMTQLYKNQLRNYEAVNLMTYCGMRMYSPHQQELIEIIKKADIK